MNRFLAFLALGLFISSSGAFAQSLGNAGTIEGTVTDASGAVVPKAQVRISNPLSNYHRATFSGADGTFRFTNVPQNPYHLEVTAPGFSPFTQDVPVRSAVPISIKASLALAGSTTTMEVESGGADLVEVDPSAHVDVDRSQFSKIPGVEPGASLSHAIVNSTGGVAADGNGFFHPLGDHAQVSFVVDGQPITDQQSKVFSTQLPANAVQAMELTTGAPNAEFGDKTSLVAAINTRTGLGAPRLFGNIDAAYGNFGTASGGAAIGFGSAKAGNFLAVEGMRSGRFLDSPEFTPFHDIGNNQTLFDRIDIQPNGKDALHLNLFAARNWIQIPNSYDQLSQDQRQRVLTWSIAPGYQHTFNAKTLLTVNPYVRKDQFSYYGSADPFNDTPATQNQARQLLNWGVRSDVAINSGRHNLKVGMDLKQTRLAENFGFGITDSTFNPICLTGNGDPAGPATLTDAGACGRFGLVPNPDLLTGLIPYDLTRGGCLFNFHATKNINQYAGYVQDAITAGNFLFSLGLRVDRYDGLTTDSAAQPRLGVAYHIKKTGTVLRASYSRTMETPFNENLLLSSATGVGGLAENVFGANSIPVPSGRRNQFNTGFQQTIGRYLRFDGDYFWKFTDNAYDFSVLLNTTITFPVAWKSSRIDGVSGRLSTVNMHGFQAYWTFGHSRARYFPPEVGGLVPQGAPLADSVFRIDHDQAFQSTASFRYQHKTAEWVAFTWRYDSGLVVSGVPDVEAALGLTAAQQVTIGFACGNVLATYANPITTCNGVGTSKLIQLPQTGQGDPDHNPARVMPRHVLNLGFGSDNLLHTEKRTHVTASVDITNLTNQTALYNFLSTFSGTHFLQPRTAVARIGLTF
jgi:hypothetical protein